MSEIKTISQCLRNNWNSINICNEEERSLRILIQNDFSVNGNFDHKFYIKYLWNEEIENG